MSQVNSSKDSQSPSPYNPAKSESQPEEEPVTFEDAWKVYRDAREHKFRPVIEKWKERLWFVAVAYQQLLILWSTLQIQGMKLWESAQQFKSRLGLQTVYNIGYARVMWLEAQLFCQRNPKLVKTVGLMFIVLFGVSLMFGVLSATGTTDRMQLAGKSGCPAHRAKIAHKRYFLRHGCEFQRDVNPLLGAASLFIKDARKRGMGATARRAGSPMRQGGRCLLLTIMGEGHSAGWLSHIKALKRTTQCVTVMYVGSHQFEEAEAAVKTEMDLYVKEFVFPNDPLHRMPTVLDPEYVNLVKTIQPETTVLLIDSRTTNVDILKGFTQGLSSGRVGAVMWEHYSHDANSKFEPKDLREEVELMVTEGFNVYMPSAKHQDEAPDSEDTGTAMGAIVGLNVSALKDVASGMASTVIQPSVIEDDTKYHSGPWLRIEGGYWDPVYASLPGVDKENGVGVVAIRRTHPFRTIVDSEALICRPPKVLQLLSKYDKKWVSTTNLVDKNNPADEEDKVDGGLCECQQDLYQEARACALFSPPPPVPSGSLYYAEWYKNHTGANDIAPPQAPEAPAMSPPPHIPIMQSVTHDVVP